MPKKNRGGFSLVETIVAIAVLLIIMAVAGSAFASMLRSMVASQSIYAMHEAENRVRMALLTIARDARLNVIDLWTDDEDYLNTYKEGIKDRFQLYDIEFKFDDPHVLTVTVWSRVAPYEGGEYLPFRGDGLELSISIPVRRLVPVN